MNTEQLKIDVTQFIISKGVDNRNIMGPSGYLQLDDLLTDFASQEIQRDRESRWISVKERLPEDGQMVLIQSTDNAMFPVVSRYRKSHKLQFIIPYRSDLDVKNVTHWQPLPEAPKL